MNATMQYFTVQAEYESGPSTKGWSVSQAPELGVVQSVRFAQWYAHCRRQGMSHDKARASAVADSKAHQSEYRGGARRAWSE